MLGLGFEFREGRNALTPDFNGEEKGLMEEMGDSTEGL